MTTVAMTLWLTSVAGMIAFGSRQMPLDSLENGLRSRSIETVLISPGMEPSIDENAVIQTIGWRASMFHYYTQVILVAPGQVASVRSENETPVRVGADFAKTIRELNPAVSIIRSQEGSSATANLYSSRVPVFVAVAAVLCLVATLQILLTGADPALASRWTWFWIITTGVGIILFLGFSTAMARRVKYRFPRAEVPAVIAFVIACTWAAVVWPTI